MQARQTRNPRAMRHSVGRPPAPSAMPRSIKVGMVITVLLIIAMLVAQWAMQAYIDTTRALRQAEYDRVVSAHKLKYRSLIEKYAGQNNLEPAFVAAVMMSESSFRADAESSVGARGLMQLMPETAQWIAGKLDEEDSYSFEKMYDPETNIRYGTWYLGYLANTFNGDPVLVASSYHAGQGYVKNLVSSGTTALSDFGDGPTKDYAGKVTKAYGVYERLYFASDAEIAADSSQY